ncbi:carbohydrate ABC transporter permease [Paenibacillus radicis (ex Xue et al. 2023)]|uniref:Carbohydrate ABC transporter permease n=1 Tax=Paenibacillus radicis (ex Xue et al. 2023) TaxID=2972489 RepID=A0ABT1YT03_9BACL|nr:carbohydrate ABC transporter permease [Paenibacillus radicis (ex Xue et al. 2023)]MCR8635825.1 carbohydrate ABC transporter permease [Paenibacillus radicis (ex Xue et al. 2023)]
MIDDKSLSPRLLDLFIYVCLTAMALLTLLPFVYILLSSFASTEQALSKSVVLIPTQYSLDAYKFIFSSSTTVRSLIFSILITVVGTGVNLVFTSLMAYPLAGKDLKGRRAILLMVLFTMLFNGGIIPLFLVVKTMGLLDSFWSLVIPFAISPFYLIIMKNFFQQLPDGIEESAKMDGCNELQILIRIVLPLSAPALASFALFYAVYHWNSFFHAIMFINDSKKWPIQVLLRQIVILSSGAFDQSSSEEAIPPSETIKNAIIIVSTVPILMIYPFLQKHFAKGLLLGSVKG